MLKEMMLGALALITWCVSIYFTVMVGGAILYTSLKGY